MAKQTEPKVYLIGRPALDVIETCEYLARVGVSDDWISGKPANAETLVEIAGKLCYKSFEPGLNPNVTKVRDDQSKFITNLLNQKHGSVFEHATYNFIFEDVSRVFTHELVRHRQGVAISQESLRYVRLSNGIRYYMPPEIAENADGRAIFMEAMDYLEKVQQRLADVYQIDEMTDFDAKKKLTSAFRRVAPDGLATHILWSANLRTLRYVIEQRTNRHAEREIRMVFGTVAQLMRVECPKVFADYKIEVIDGLEEYTTENRKV